MSKLQEAINKVKDDIITDISWCEWNSCEGYTIKTENHTVSMGISTEQQCCENAGMIDCPDDLSKFIGSSIVKINPIGLANGFNITDDLDNVAFISVDTTNGQFQFAVYNEHNGYYSHSVVIIVDDIVVDSEGV